MSMSEAAAPIAICSSGFRGAIGRPRGRQRAGVQKTLTDLLETELGHARLTSICLLKKKGEGEKEVLTSSTREEENSSSQRDSFVNL